MARRLALLLLALAVVLPAAWRRLRPLPAPARICEPEGRGVEPRHWVGCRADPGAPRALSGNERLRFGLPVDLDDARAEDLAAVPGLSRGLAAEIVSDRARRGPFASVEDLERVRGIGPARMARARPFLRVRPKP